MNDNDISMTPVGIVHSPFQQKFGIPRQPGLVPQIKGRIELLPPFNHPDCVRGLEAFSHIWVLFLFHQTQTAGWHPLVRPPRLGGKERVGVFASRSNFRPNPIGQSVVRLDAVDLGDNDVALTISGHDLLDQTPVIDIKPYLGYADRIADSRDGYAQGTPASLQVSFSETAKQQCEALEASGYTKLAQQLEAMLVQDPRPAYHKHTAPSRHYGLQFADLDIGFQVLDNRLLVITRIEGIDTGNKR